LTWDRADRQQTDYYPLVSVRDIHYLKSYLQFAKRFAGLDEFFQHLEQSQSRVQKPIWKDSMNEQRRSINNSLRNILPGKPD